MRGRHARWVAWLAVVAVALAAGPAAAGERITVTRAAMAQAVVAALRLPPTRLGPPYADLPLDLPGASAVEAGANAGLWGPWELGTRFWPERPATLGMLLSAVATGLGYGHVVHDAPGGLKAVARALGLWPPGGSGLGAV